MVLPSRMENVLFLGRVDAMLAAASHVRPEAAGPSLSRDKRQPITTALSRKL